MAILKMEFDQSQFNVMRKLVDLFPELRAMCMGYIGKVGKERLRRRFLMGQEITLRKYPIDAIGRRTVSYTVGRDAKHVRIASYPMNLFERGRMLRSGKKEKGKHVILGKFKNMIKSDLQSIVNDFDNMYLQKKLSKIKLSG